ncbi:hypothetical protein [Natrinema amylolyticum]|uniref:hypothetical protein n=1 Tax=Natrinema amylolyticum TaxID=2878679 RepID=UPI001CFC2F0A|nr:hypothetical protein [Natrinema amylolyticum]
MTPRQKTKRHIDGIDRRLFLQTTAVLAGGALVTGTVDGSRRDSVPSELPTPADHDVHWGESDTDGGVRTYATTDREGRLSSLGVHVGGDALMAFDEEESATHLHFPKETDDGVDIDLHQFTYVGFHYNPQGHAPPGIYDVPHFDFHFYMMAEDIVEGISGGPLESTPLPFVGLADYDVPADQFPEGYMFEEHRLIVERMGEHLLDETAPEFHGEAFTHTNVYGVYDPSIDPEQPADTEVIELEGERVEVPVYEGDGEGRVHFVEPMVTTDFLRNDLEEETTVDVATPGVYFETDDYPTSYAIMPDGDGGAYVSIREFEEFHGPDQ